ncbi:MAG: hypothetical protein H7Y38_01660 [Armatimonadetes bacterium]|nr:hypothetical protein [Armatimonadota bacterium]
MVNGLLGEYSSGTTTVRRTDPAIDFTWGSQSPAPGIAADNFRVKWSGQIEAPVSGTYTFSTRVDDIVRVYVDNQLLLDIPQNQYEIVFFGRSITLQAGRRYDIRIEYREYTGDAIARLFWQYPGQSRQVVPSNRLFSVPVTTDTSAPTAPVNLTALGAWSNSCCNGQAMAHIALSWARPTTGVPLTKFNVYRDEVRIKTGVTTTNWEDMSVLSGQTYIYRVTGVAADGRESPKSAPAQGTAPFAPVASTGKTAPNNLRIAGIWDAGANAPSDALTWDAVTGAASYNIYQYDTLIGTGVTRPTYTVPASKYVKGMTYTVTAVDAGGAETLPSNTVGAQGGLNPSSPPNWVPRLPLAPHTLTAATQWNAGSPRVSLAWQGGSNAYTFDVYKNGVKVARDLWGQTWLDNAVRVGDTATYTVAGVNLPFQVAAEGARSAPVTVRVSAAPITGGKVIIKRVVPNDDSVILYFDAVPGAVDYRVYNMATPGTYKYSGGGLSAEMNGLTPGTPAVLVVEAVDKWGPFQKMDGMMGPGAVGHEGHISMAINGLGDPSNIPVVLASSAPTTVTPVARTLHGAQAFFDTFRNSKAFVSASVPPAMLAANPGEVQAVKNDKWTLYNVRGDQKNSRAFVMSNHFMDTLYDGGTPGVSSPLHTAYASLVMEPNAVANFSGNKVLHVTFEVDAHFSGRRWCDVLIAGEDDTLLHPGNGFEGKNLLPTVSGQVFLWQILKDVHTGKIVRGKDAAGKLITVPLFEQANGVGPDSFGPPSRRHIVWSDLPAFNGSPADLDKRHRFDLYLSRNRFLIMEEGKLVKDKIFPGGVTLPFTRAKVYFLHQVYHTGLERSEAIAYPTGDSYWVNHRPFADERHWDNMGFEVLNSFPVIP